MADVYVNALTTISTEPSSTDSLVCVNRNTNEGQIIDYNLLADKILDKLTSKTFSGLNTTSKLLVGAINEQGLDLYNANQDITDLSTAPTQLFEISASDTTETSKACNWTEYRMLLITLGNYGNVYTTILVPRTLFNTTTTGTKIYVYFFNSNGVVNYAMLRKNGDTAVYVQFNAANENHKLRLYGIK